MTYENSTYSQMKFTKKIIHTIAKLTRFIFFLPSQRFS